MPFPVMFERRDVTFEDFLGSIGEATCLATILVCLGEVYHIIVALCGVLISLKVYDYWYNLHATPIPLQELQYLDSIDKKLSIEVLRKTSIKRKL